MPQPTPIKISIPQPCNEDWNKMTPVDQGRFCSSCQKCVIDFTTFTDKQLYEYITAHKNQQVCGRFRHTQLNRTLQIPPQPHSRLYRYFIGLGLTLVLAQIPTEQLRAKTPYSYQSINEYNAPQEDNNEDSIIIRGKVIDENNEAIVGAIAELHYSKDKIISTLTDDSGHYRLVISSYSGEFHLKIKAIYYKPVTIRFNEKKGINTFLVTTLRTSATIGLLEIKTINYRVPLLDEGNRRVITSEEIEKMAH